MAELPGEYIVIVVLEGQGGRPGGFTLSNTRGERVFVANAEDPYAREFLWQSIISR